MKSIPFCADVARPQSQDKSCPKALLARAFRSRTLAFSLALSATAFSVAQFLGAQQGRQVHAGSAIRFARIEAVSAVLPLPAKDPSDRVRDDTLPSVPSSQPLVMQKSGVLR